MVAVLSGICLNISSVIPALEDGDRGSDVVLYFHNILEDKKTVYVYTKNGHTATNLLD
jgi:hypothetical protein